jgi:hypothetical protein
MQITNEAARAYAAIAAQNIGVKLDDIMLLVDEMAYLMDVYIEMEIIVKMHKLIDQDGTK